MIATKSATLSDVAEKLPKLRRAQAIDLAAHLPAGFTFEDDVWNTWTWGRFNHRQGTVTADFSSIRHAELRAAAKLLVLSARATKKVSNNYPKTIISISEVLGDVLQARTLAAITNSDLMQCEQRIFSAYQDATTKLGVLAVISGFLSDWFDCSVTYRKPKTAKLRYGTSGTDKGRVEKLVPDSVLGAILALRTRPDLDVEDRLLVNALALNVACGFRVSELLTLPRDCLVHDENSLYVRNFEAKRGKTAPRLVPPQLKPVVEHAVSEIIKITDAGREIVDQWSTSDNPDWWRVLEDERALKYFTQKLLHRWTSDPDHRLINPNAAWHSGRHEWIDVLGALARNGGAVNKTTSDLNLDWSTFRNLCLQQEASREGRLYTRTSERSLSHWLKDRRFMNQYRFFQSIGFASGQYRNLPLLQLLMEDAASAQLSGQAYPAPPNDPGLEAEYGRQRPVLLKSKSGKPLLYVDQALMVVPKFLLGSHETKTNLFKVIEAPQMIHWLAGRRGRASVFERFEINDPRTGEVAKFTSHDIRHWLNTAYFRGGLTNVQIATLFNRNDPRGNSPYNQMTNEERREAVSGGVQDAVITGHISDTYRAIAEVDRDEAEQYLRAMTRQLNVMPHGICAKDLVTDPCPHHLSCFSCEVDPNGVGKPCSFLILDRTDRTQLEEVKRLHQNAEAMLEWLRDDDMADSPQFRHFKNVKESSGEVLKGADAP